jgi:hypothetical protein
MRKNLVQFKIRIPKDVHAFIAEEAEKTIEHVVTKWSLG